MCSDEVLVERPPLNPHLMVHAPSKVLIQLTWLRPVTAEKREAWDMQTIYCFSKRGRRNGMSDLSHSSLERQKLLTIQVDNCQQKPNFAFLTINLNRWVILENVKMEHPPPTAWSSSSPTVKIQRQGWPINQPLPEQMSAPREEWTLNIPL